MAKTKTQRKRKRARLEAAQASGAKCIVYVHGICRHNAGYSDPWLAALAPFLANASSWNSREVLWSDIVHPETLEGVSRKEAANRNVLEIMHPQALAKGESDVVVEIKDILADRAHRQLVQASQETTGPEGVQTPLLTREPIAAEALVGIPGLDCINDFGQYLIDDDVRRQVIDRFHQVVRPILKEGGQLEIISHSWGTVVAYEGLRLLDGENLPEGVHTFFTVGSALAIGPVKRRLLAEAIDGRRPRLARTWVNLDARFDVVGGPMQGVPFGVDFEYLGLTPVGCSRVIPNPACAHSSYFNADNLAVNRDIFARHIES